MKINLLKGIHQFKEELGESVDLDEDDVKFAGAIILNSKLIPQNSWVDEEPEEEKEEEGDEEDERDTTNFDIDFSGFFPGDDDHGDSPMEEVGYGSDVN